LDAGADHDTVTVEATPVAIAVGDIGAPGTEHGITDDVVATEPFPATFVAAIVNV